MGLDVNLYYFDNFEKTMETRRSFQKARNAIWTEFGKSYDDMSPQEKAINRQKVKDLEKTMGTDSDGMSGAVAKVNIQSQRHPSHLFQIGHFRNSYNPGSTNTVLRKLVNKDLYFIFDIREEPYYTLPDWKKVKQNIADIRENILHILNTRKGIHFVYAIPSRNLDEDNIPTDSSQAMEIFYDEIKKDIGSNYNTYAGYFNFHEKWKVAAVIPGVDKSGKQTTYIVVDTDIQEHLDALDVIEETADWVLSQPDAEKYRLSWVD